MTHKDDKDKKHKKEPEPQADSPSQESPACSDTEFLKLKLLDAEQKLQQITEAGKRAMADMENMKRRMEEDRSRMALFANVDFIKQLLPALDNLHLAQAHIPQDCPDNVKEWLNGITKIFDQINTVLMQAGVLEINPINQPFDPRFHEAVMQDKGPLNQITAVLEKGYMLGTHVLRPAKVKVGMGE